MKTVRIAGTATIVVLAVLLIRILSTGPYQANTLKKRTEAGFQALSASLAGPAPSSKTLEAARDIVASLRSALRYTPTDVDLHLELAAHYGIMGRLDEQIATYERLLKFHRRPEIFLNLGLSEFENGRVDVAVRFFGTAVAFDYLYIHSVPEVLKEDVARYAEGRRASLAGELTWR